MQATCEEKAGAELRTRPGRKAGQSSIALKSRRLTDEQSYLAGEHWDKAMQLARIQRDKRPTIHLDWEGAAAVALCDSAFGFDPKRKVKFWTYASARIQFAFIDLMRAERAKGYGRYRNFEDAPDIWSLDHMHIEGMRGETWRYTLGELTPNGRISESRVCQIHTQSIALLREIVKPESLAS
jgi:hypothetical protein